MKRCARWTLTLPPTQPKVYSAISLRGCYSDMAGFGPSVGSQHGVASHPTIFRVRRAGEGKGEGALKATAT